MRNLILAIFGVLCLDIVFIAYMGGDGPLNVKGAEPALYNVGPIDPPQHPTALTVFDEPFYADTITAAVRPVTRSTFVHAAVRTEHSRSGDLARNPLRPKFIRAAPNDTLIAKGVTKLDTLPQHLTEMLPSKKPDSKSFVAMVLPIVKKPVGWVKTAVSKMF
jgi:hypothetical protein